MIKNILERGNINLFPRDRNIKIRPAFSKILSDQEAMKNDWKKVGEDMWKAFEILEKKK